ncbi:MAG: sugar O-acetyltransferase, partial [Thermodesulfobacteriota bacterium]
LRYAKITIGEGVWISADAIVLLGVTIGKGAGVSPGAIVHKDVPPSKKAVAPPARIIQSIPEGHLNNTQEEEKV